MKFLTIRKYKLSRSTAYSYGTHDRTLIIFRLFGIKIWSHTRKPAKRKAV